MSSGHRTSTIVRPAEARDPSRATRRDRDDTRLIQRRRSRHAFSIAGLVIVVALAAALFVLPMRGWLNQRDELRRRSQDLSELEAANDRLEAENAQLQTAEGIAQAAREDLAYQEANERTVAALPPPDVPGILPTGWPYDLVTEILAVRSAGGAAPASGAPSGTFPSYSPGG